MVSELKILQSAAGYYIGRLWSEDKIEWVPYSRESNYFKSYQAARIALINNDYIENYDTNN